MVENERSVRNLLRNGHIVIVRIPRSEAVFRSTSGDLIEWSELSVLFPPDSWMAWAIAHGGVSPYKVPAVESFLMTQGFHPVEPTMAEPALVLTARTAPVVVPLSGVTANASTEKLLEIVRVFLGFEEAEREAVRPTFVYDFRPIVGGPFDQGGRHIADKSG